VILWFCKTPGAAQSLGSGSAEGRAPRAPRFAALPLPPHCGTVRGNRGEKANQGHFSGAVSISSPPAKGPVKRGEAKAGRPPGVRRAGSRGTLAGGRLTRPRAQRRDLTAGAAAQSWFVTRTQSKRQRIHAAERAGLAFPVVFNARAERCREPSGLPRAPGDAGGCHRPLSPAPSRGAAAGAGLAPGLARSRAGAKLARAPDFAEMGFCLDSGQDSPKTSPKTCLNSEHFLCNHWFFSTGSFK